MYDIKRALCRGKRMFSSEVFKNVIYGCERCLSSQKQEISCALSSYALHPTIQFTVFIFYRVNFRVFTLLNVSSLKGHGLLQHCTSTPF